jgi:uncharacterized membrane protein
MSMFLLTLIAPALWAVANHLDKIIVSRYFQNASLGAMMIFSALIGIAVLPVAFIFQDQAFAVGVITPLVILANGCLYLLGVQLYLMALRAGDASACVPILQLTPVISFVLAYLILGETLSANQLIGGVFIVSGALLISLEISLGKRTRWRADILSLMLLSSFLHSVQYLLFKVFATQINFWSTMFWESLGFVCFGIFLLVFVKSYRLDFLTVFGKKWRATGMNLLGELVNITGKITFNYISLLIPITLAWLGVGFQPLFVLVYSLILTVFFPHISTENVLGSHLIQRALAIGLMVVGAFILNT